MSNILMIQNLIECSLVCDWTVVPFDLERKITIDSRQCVSGDFFIAIAGENFDGHDFLTDVAKLPVAGALVEEHFFKKAYSMNMKNIDRYQCWWDKIPILTVSNTRQALLNLASAWRRQHNDVLSAVVIGSNGKTTVKEMVALIFREAIGNNRVLSSLGNYNNDIGLPLSVLGLRKHIQLAVFELGINHPGETYRLAEVAKPNIVLINNAQKEHQEYMKSVEAVAMEHASAILALNSQGILIIPADDLYAHIWRKAAGPCRVIEFSLQTDCVDESNLTSDRVIGRLHPTSCTNVLIEAKPLVPQNLEIFSKNVRFKVSLHMAGKHNALNAVAATAVGIACNLNQDAIRLGLEKFQPIAGRLKQTFLFNKHYAGLILLDDSYNANPDSVRAALDVLSDQCGKKIMIFGDMGEIGENIIEEHSQIGCYAAFAKIDAFFTIGNNSCYAWRTFCFNKKCSTHGGHFLLKKELLEAVNQYFLSYANDKELVYLLIKGSNFMHMDYFVQHFMMENLN